MPIYFIVEWQIPKVNQERVQEVRQAKIKKAAIEAAAGYYENPLPVLRVMLAAIQNGTEWEAGSLQAPDDWKALADSAENSPAAWTLEPADPESAASKYIVRNVKTGRLLAMPQADKNSVPLELGPTPMPAWEFATHTRK